MLQVQEQQTGPSNVGMPGATIPMGVRILAVALRALFIGALVAVTVRVSSPQSESLASVHETLGDLTLGEGEAAVQTAFPNAVIIRPAVMFAPDDAFLTTILRLLRSLPAYPMFGDGRTRLQPAIAVPEALRTKNNILRKAGSSLIGQTGWQIKQIAIRRDLQATRDTGFRGFDGSRKAHERNKRATET
jgi:hypothetical protein